VDQLVTAGATTAGLGVGAQADPGGGEVAFGPDPGSTVGTGSVGATVGGPDGAQVAANVDVPGAIDGAGGTGGRVLGGPTLPTLPTLGDVGDTVGDVVGSLPTLPTLPTITLPTLPTLPDVGSTVTNLGDTAGDTVTNLGDTLGSTTTNLGDTLGSTTT